MSAPPNLPLRVSVILPTHRPDPTRLQRALLGLAAQTLPAAQWEILLVDNASTPPVSAETLGPTAPANLRIIREPELGLTSARRCGFKAAAAPLIVMVDDDNVLAPDYLARVVELFAAHPRIGALGGRSLPEFSTQPADWMREFHGLLACRDLGPDPLVSAGLRPAGSPHNQYPSFAPIGAGMALRRVAVETWLADSGPGGLSDRRGAELTSGGDNDIVLRAMRAGWEVGYFPQLSLLHLIPASRLDPDYLARLNRGIQRSWMQVLARHDASDWPPLSPLGAALRKARAWFTYRAWASPAARIRWQGACGHFDGRAASRLP